MTRTMGDSTDLAAIPLTVQVAAAYYNGHIGVVTPAQLEARFPHARYGHAWIDVTGANADKADVLDVERGDATPATANLWVQSYHVLKRPGLPVLYVNRANKDATVSACASGGSVLGRDYGLWIATLDGTRITGPGIVACQFGAHGTWDESVVYDDSLWLPVVPPKPAVPTRAQALAALATLAAYVEAS